MVIFSDDHAFFQENHATEENRIPPKKIEHEISMFISLFAEKMNRQRRKGRPVSSPAVGGKPCIRCRNFASSRCLFSLAGVLKQC